MNEVDSCNNYFKKREKSNIDDWTKLFNRCNLVDSIYGILNSVTLQHTFCSSALVLSHKTSLNNKYHTHTHTTPVKISRTCCLHI